MAIINMANKNLANWLPIGLLWWEKAWRCYRVDGFFVIMMNDPICPLLYWKIVCPHADNIHKRATIQAAII